MFVSAQIYLYCNTWDIGAQKRFGNGIGEGSLASIHYLNILQVRHADRFHVFFSLYVTLASVGVLEISFP